MRMRKRKVNVDSGGELLDGEFDSLGGEGASGFDLRDEYEGYAFLDATSFRSDSPGVVPKIIGSSGRKKRAFVEYEPETRNLPEEEPPGWAEP